MMKKNHRNSGSAPQNYIRKGKRSERARQKDSEHACFKATAKKPPFFQAGYVLSAWNSMLPDQGRSHQEMSFRSTRKAWTMPSTCRVLRRMAIVSKVIHGSFSTTGKPVRFVWKTGNTEPATRQIAQGETASVLKIFAALCILIKIKCTSAAPQRGMEYE